MLKKSGWAIALGLGLMAYAPAASAGEAGGKANYDKLCASCHAADGKGNPAMAKAFGEKALNIVSKETAGKSDDEMLKVIVDGRGKMPASGKGLSKGDQTQVLQYMRSLAK